jgi:predicted nucleotidyltransferase
MAGSSANQSLTTSWVVSLLSANCDALSNEFHVASLEIFGSYARNEQTPQSDVDLLVTFSKPVGFGFIHLAERLEALLGKPVDLLVSDGIKPSRRDSILSSLVHVAP